MGAIAVIGAMLIICMVSATPEQIRHARANPPAWLTFACRLAWVVAALLVGQFFFFPPI